jgi:DHA1 family multidrug resistance protein-like MFS transporter
MGSTIYTPGLQDVMEEFGVGQTVGSLGMALYVLGYGMGPMLFSPLSE